VPVQSYVQVSPTSSPEVRLDPLGNARTADPCIVLWEYSNPGLLVGSVSGWTTYLSLGGTYLYLRFGVE